LKKWLTPFDHLAADIRFPVSNLSNGLFEDKTLSVVARVSYGHKFPTVEAKLIHRMLNLRVLSFVREE
jgi:hypothetical protein